MLKYKKFFIGPFVCLVMFMIHYPILQSAETAKINVNLTYQTIEGFGASIAWYSDWLATHPNSDDLYEIIFEDLGLSILRIRNNYRYIPGNFAPHIKTIVEKANALLDEPIPILISSWSPPADLKSNGSTENGGKEGIECPFFSSRWWA